VPVIGHNVGAEGDERTHGQPMVNLVSAVKGGNAEERRQMLRIAKRGTHRGDAVVDLVV
jgi:hypothetical protein